MGQTHVQNLVLSPRTRVTFNDVTRPPRAPVPKQPSWSREGSHRVAQPPGQFQPERRQERGGRSLGKGRGAGAQLAIHANWTPRLLGFAPSSPSSQSPLSRSPHGTVLRTIGRSFAGRQVPGRPAWNAVPPPRPRPRRPEPLLTPARAEGLPCAAASFFRRKRWFCSCLGCHLAQVVLK